jgi:lipid A 3-O-deacylase
MRSVLAAAFVLAAGCAHAAEVRIGVLGHDLGWNSGAGGKEGGLDLQAELVGAPLPLPAWTGRPRPSLSISANSEGDTNYAGANLIWRAQATDRLFGEFTLGYVVHDGETTLPPNPADPIRIRKDRDNIIFGSRDVFRLNLQAGVRLSERVEAALVLEHLSHGQILASGRNEGLDSAGLRLGYRFGGR